MTVVSQNAVFGRCYYYYATYRIRIGTVSLARICLLTLSANISTIKFVKPCASPGATLPVIHACMFRHSTLTTRNIHPTCRPWENASRFKHQDNFVQRAQEAQESRNKTTLIAVQKLLDTHHGALSSSMLLPTGSRLHFLQLGLSHCAQRSSTGSTAILLSFPSPGIALSASSPAAAVLAEESSQGAAMRIPKGWFLRRSALPKASHCH